MIYFSTKNSDHEIGRCNWPRHPFHSLVERGDQVGGEEVSDSALGVHEEGVVLLCQGQQELVPNALQVFSTLHQCSHQVESRTECFIFLPREVNHKAREVQGEGQLPSKLGKFSQNTCGQSK